MGEHFTSLLRAGVGLALATLAVPLQARAWLARKAYRLTQARLRRKLGIRADTPIVDFAGTEVRLAALRAQLGSRVIEAQTSGTSREPKRLLYTHGRVARTRGVFLEVFTRLFQGLRIRRKSLFVIAPIEVEPSLTSLLVADARLPSRAACAQAPYRVERHPALDSVRARYGAVAVRTWLLAASNPGVLYATNPSTLALFFDSLPEAWASVRQLARDFSAGRLPELNAVWGRIAVSGAASRVQNLCASEAPLPLPSWLPGLEAFICWDGGYVAPFLERLRGHLPPERYRFIPMYSMSTEVIETVGICVGRRVAFLPMAPGVLYELGPVDGPASAADLVAPWEAKPGREYTLIVSDGYGLARYQTEDVFRCEGMVDGLPDLRFRRRQGLAWSFTGEKLTGTQLAHAFDEARAEAPELERARHLTCAPAVTTSERLPHYVFLVVGLPEGETVSAARGAELVSLLEERIGAANSEFVAKRRSGRLGPPSLQWVSVDEFLAWAGARSSDGQFKFLPLYPRPWEEGRRPALPMRGAPHAGLESGVTS